MATFYNVGEEDTRPWGHWQVIDAGSFHVVKRITVIPGARLSLQYHHHREEVWTCVAGNGIAVINEQEVVLSPGVTVFIPKTAHHRMVCTGDQPMLILETQLGETLDENDIVRIEDDFGRVF
nr:phosphomannose isomerase type II C-terminal cupin domain [uncultured Cohaesibacter sp.]